ncbi:proteasome subunit [Caedimonas varicaedens]|uniref:Proteasome subunit n=1 Tax=Caedimonas varicaedens TaxID=1629334 RepID=A0A0K8MEA1_9PROT|nr:proteasome subunit [Caedimonas varicaedens]
MENQIMKDSDMTVCIASIAQGGYLLAASDRMLSESSIKFEPQTSKIISLTDSILLMTAGDVSLQSEILGYMKEYIENKKNENDSIADFYVTELANHYSLIYDYIRKQRMTKKILSPYGLTTETFLEKQHTLSKDFITDISWKMSNYTISSPVSALVAGIDSRGTHIYTIVDNDVRCSSSLGFSAIGEGWSHAHSQFVLAKHDSESSLEDSILLTYLAKKRSEVAPSVGQETDFWLIDPHRKNSSSIRDDLKKALELEYIKMTKGEQKAFSSAKSGVKTFIENILH